MSHFCAIKIETNLSDFKILPHNERLKIKRNRNFMSLHKYAHPFWDFQIGTMLHLTLTTFPKRHSFCALNFSNTRKTEHVRERPYIKKPPNAFMLFANKYREVVTMQLEKRDSASVHVALGKMVGYALLEDHSGKRTALIEMSCPSSLQKYWTGMVNSFVFVVSWRHVGFRSKDKNESGFYFQQKYWHGHD